MRIPSSKIHVAAAALALIFSINGQLSAATITAISGSPMAEEISFVFVVYFLPSPSSDPMTATKESLKAFPDLQLIEPPKAAKAPGMRLIPQLASDVQQRNAIPNLKQLERFGRGISRGQAEALQHSEQALALIFKHSKRDVFKAAKIADSVVAAIAQKTGGLIWDDETREMFTVDEWRKRRVATWENELPDIGQQITMHAYNSGEFARAITLGMSKFGLPDIVVQQFSWSENRSVGNLINLFAQAMAEGANFSKAGEYDIKLRGIRNAAARKSQLTNLGNNAESEARLSFKPGTWEAGDPENRLIEITFDRYPGNDIHARRGKMLASIWGWEEKTVYVKHDGELEAASINAKAKLPALEMAFKAGLAPGEYILLKAPFRMPDGGREWMWVEVTEWQGNQIKGLLKNEPKQIPQLHGGQMVSVRQDEVFDFIRRFPDGTEEGNETGKIIERAGRR